MVMQNLQNLRLQPFSVHVLPQKAMSLVAPQR